MTFLAWNIDDRCGRGNKYWSIIFRFVYQFWNWTRFWMLRIILPKICDEFFYLWYECLLAHIQWATKTCLSWTWTLKFMEVDGGWWWLMVVEFLGIVNAPEREIRWLHSYLHIIYIHFISFKSICLGAKYWWELFFQINIQFLMIVGCGSDGFWYIYSYLLKTNHIIQSTLSNLNVTLIGICDRWT